MLWRIQRRRQQAKYKMAQVLGVPPVAFQPFCVWQLPQTKNFFNRFLKNFPVLYFSFPFPAPLFLLFSPLLPSFLHVSHPSSLPSSFPFFPPLLSYFPSSSLVLSFRGRQTHDMTKWHRAGKEYYLWVQSIQRMVIAVQGLIKSGEIWIL